MKSAIPRIIIIVLLVSLVSWVSYNLINPTQYKYIVKVTYWNGQLDSVSTVGHGISLESGDLWSEHRVFVSGVRRFEVISKTEIK